MTEEMNKNPENHESGEHDTQTPPDASPTGFLVRWIGMLPERMFPEITPPSARICALIGMVVGGFALLFSFIPCFGENAIWFALPGLYVSMLAIRRAPPEDSDVHLKAAIGTILSVLALIGALFWIIKLACVRSEMNRALDSFPF